MNADEFQEMRARKDIPHDDELGWSAHDRIPDRETEFGYNMPSKGYCVAFVVLPIVLLMIAYLLGVI